MLSIIKKWIMVVYGGTRSRYGRQNFHVVWRYWDEKHLRQKARAVNKQNSWVLIPSSHSVTYFRCKNDFPQFWPLFWLSRKSSKMPLSFDEFSSRGFCPVRRMALIKWQFKAISPWNPNKWQMTNEVYW